MESKDKRKRKASVEEDGNERRPSKARRCSWLYAVCWRAAWYFASTLHKASWWLEQPEQLPTPAKPTDPPVPAKELSPARDRNATVRCVGSRQPGTNSPAAKRSLQRGHKTILRLPRFPGPSLRAAQAARLANSSHSPIWDNRDPADEPAKQSNNNQFPSTPCRVSLDSPCKPTGPALALEHRMQLADSSPFSKWTTQAPCSTAAATVTLASRKKRIAHAFKTPPVKAQRQYNRADRTNSSTCASSRPEAKAEVRAYEAEDWPSSGLPAATPEECLAGSATPNKETAHADFRAPGTSPDGAEAPSDSADRRDSSSYASSRPEAKAEVKANEAQDRDPFGSPAAAAAETPLAGKACDTPLDDLAEWASTLEDLQQPRAESSLAQDLSLHQEDSSRILAPVACELESSGSANLDMLANAASFDEPDWMDYEMSTPPMADEDKPSPLPAAAPQRKRHVSFTLPDTHTPRIDDGGTPNLHRRVPRLPRHLRGQPDPEEPRQRKMRYSPAKCDRKSGMMNVMGPAASNMLFKLIKCPDPSDQNDEPPACSNTDVRAESPNSLQRVYDSSPNDAVWDEASPSRSPHGRVGTLRSLPRQLFHVREPAWARPTTYRGPKRPIRPSANNDMEQIYREGYLNNKLATSWEAGEEWARTDFHGLELSLPQCIRHHDAFKIASRRLLYSHGDYAAAAIKSEVETEWQQLEEVRRRFSSSLSVSQNGGNAGGRRHMVRGILKKKPAAQMRAEATEEAIVEATVAIQVLANVPHF